MSFPVGLSKTLVVHSQPTNHYFDDKKKQKSIALWLHAHKGSDQILEYDQIDHQKLKLAATTHIKCVAEVAELFSRVLPIQTLQATIGEYSWATSNEVQSPQQLHDQIVNIEFGIDLTNSSVLKNCRIICFEALIKNNNSQENIKSIRALFFRITSYSDSASFEARFPLIEGITDQFEALKERIRVQGAEANNEAPLYGRLFAQVRENFAANPITTKKLESFTIELILNAPSAVAKQLIENGAPTHFKDHNNCTILQNAIHAFVYKIYGAIDRCRHTLESKPPRGHQFYEELKNADENSITQFMDFIKWLIEKKSGIDQGDIDAFNKAKSFCDKSFKGSKMARGTIYLAPDAKPEQDLIKIDTLETLLVLNLQAKEKTLPPSTNPTQPQTVAPQNEMTIVAVSEKAAPKKLTRVELFNEAIGYTMSADDLSGTKKSVSTLLTLILINYKLEKGKLLGKAVDNGDCFFHAFAQALNALRHKKGLKPVTAVELRRQAAEICDDTDLAKHWTKTTVPVWGDPVSHGKRLCQLYNVNLKMIMADLPGMTASKAEKLATAQKEERFKYFDNHDNYVFGEDHAESFVADPDCPTLEMVVARKHYMPIFNAADIA